MGKQVAGDYLRRKGSLLCGMCVPTPTSNAHSVCIIMAYRAWMWWIFILRDDYIKLHLRMHRPENPEFVDLSLQYCISAVSSDCWIGHRLSAPLMPIHSITKTLAVRQLTVYVPLPSHSHTTSFHFFPS